MFQPAFTARQPGKCSNDECCMQKSCITKKDCEKKQPKKDCNSNGCNPFMACWCGNFFVIERPFASGVPMADISADFVNRDEENTAGVAFECWHPPEMI